MEKSKQHQDAKTTQQENALGKEIALLTYTVRQLVDLNREIIRINTELVAELKRAKVIQVPYPVQMPPAQPQMIPPVRQPVRGPINPTGRAY